MHEMEWVNTRVIELYPAEDQTDDENADGEVEGSEQEAIMGPLDDDDVWQVKYIWGIGTDWFRVNHKMTKIQWTLVMRLTSEKCMKMVRTIPSQLD